MNQMNYLMKQIHKKMDLLMLMKWDNFQIKYVHIKIDKYIIVQIKINVVILMNNN